MVRAAWLLGSGLLVAIQLVRAQVAPLPSLPAPRVAALDRVAVAVAPQAADIRDWLLLDKDLHLELEGAMQYLYNFEFERADKQFRSLRRRYPQHPLPYFLVGLSTWWRLAPYPTTDTRYDARFYAYLDSAETKAYQLGRVDERNEEAYFFLAAAHGYEARLASDRHQWRRATVASRRALDYLQQSCGANGLSAEFRLGYGLFGNWSATRRGPGAQRPTCASTPPPNIPFPLPMFLPFLLLGLLRPASPLPYSATVVDATTNQPLAGVRVLASEPAGVPATTDARGRFTLPAAPRTLDLARLGYAPLHLAVPPQSTGSDTLRLLPRSYALPEASVRPPQASTLASVPAGGPELGRRLYPGQAVALLLERPAAALPDQPCVVSEVCLFLTERPRQGRLRVRLVEVLPGPPARPGTHDLLPTPAIFSAEQLARARRGKLVLNVSTAGLLLPAAGLCVVVECLPTDPADQDAVVSTTRDAKGRATVTLTSPGTAPRPFPGADFPLLTAGRGAGVGTWSYYPDRPTWSTRSALAYTVRTEVRVLSY